MRIPDGPLFPRWEVEGTNFEYIGGLAYYVGYNTRLPKGWEAYPVWARELPLFISIVNEHNHHQRWRFRDEQTFRGYAVFDTEGRQVERGDPRLEQAKHLYQEAQ